MILSTDANSLKIDNGQEFNNPISIKLETGWGGQYTDFVITIPKNSEVSRGKTQLKNNGEPYKIRVYENR